MNWPLLHKYLTGESTPDEREKVDRWMKKDEKNREFFDSLIKIWSVQPHDNVEVDAQKAWESFSKKLPEADKKDKINPLKKTKDRFNRKGYNRVTTFSAAAAALLVVALYLYLFFPGLFYQDQSLAQKQPQVQKIETAMGQRTSFRLFDGTHIYLNAASMVRISPYYGDTTRTIYLQGEAFFDVAHNPEAPFIVRTGEGYSRVLGTKFAVKSYPGDHQMQVTVEEGRVRLASEEKPEQAAELTKSTLGLLGADGNTQVRKVANLAEYVAWKDGQLVFESTPFQKVIPRLERWYNIRIKADSALYSQKVTASFDTEPVMEVLSVLALSLDARFKRNKRQISFNSK